MHRPLALTLLLFTAVALAGCGGGGKSIDDVRSCLQKANFTVKGAEGPDADEVEDAVSGTATGTGDGLNALTIAVAAEVKNKDLVDKVSDANTKFLDQLDAETRKKFQLESGDEGTYIWIIAGNKSSAAYRSGSGCVKP